MSAPAGHGDGGQVDDGIAFLDALAAQLRGRGWTAYLSTAPGRLPRPVRPGPAPARTVR